VRGLVALNTSFKTFGTSSHHNTGGMLPSPGTTVTFAKTVHVTSVTVVVQGNRYLGTMARRLRSAVG
jgi:hypothetical protein